MTLSHPRDLVPQTWIPPPTQSMGHTSSKTTATGHPIITSWTTCSHMRLTIMLKLAMKITVFGLKNCSMNPRLDHFRSKHNNNPPISSPAPPGRRIVRLCLSIMHLNLRSLRATIRSIFTKHGTHLSQLLMIDSSRDHPLLLDHTTPILTSLI